MYIYEYDESTTDIDIKTELKEIAKNLGYSYIEQNTTINANGIHRGVIQVGQVIIKIIYSTYIKEINVVLDNNTFNCTTGVKSITTLSVELQTASMIVKSIQESKLMD